jgi:hypothetical protein
MTIVLRASAVATAKGPRKSSQHGCLIGSENNRPRTKSQVHIEVAAAELGTTPYWLRLRLRAIGISVGDSVTREQLRALSDSSRASAAIARKLRREDRHGSSRISWRNQLGRMRSRDDLSAPRATRPDPSQPDGVYIAAAGEALYSRMHFIGPRQRGRI